MTDYKKDFPCLRVPDIAYLDNAATAQRPEKVLKAVEDFYTKKISIRSAGSMSWESRRRRHMKRQESACGKFINAGKIEGDEAVMLHATAPKA